MTKLSGDVATIQQQAHCRNQGIYLSSLRGSAQIQTRLSTTAATHVADRASKQPTAQQVMEAKPL